MTGMCASPAADRAGATASGLTGLMIRTFTPRVIRSWMSLFCLFTSPLASSTISRSPPAFAAASAPVLSCT
jgi:hypothetical protein